MSSKTLAYNEQDDNHSTIHLYYNNEMHSWISYGYSAYSLRMLMKERNVETLQGFSTVKQMPYTAVHRDIVRRMRHSLNVVSGEGDRHYIVSVDKKFDLSGYDDWTDNLHRLLEENGGFDTQTHVSSMVSKEEFIKDGMSSVSRFMKRFVDCLLSLVLIIISLPLFVICAILVYMEDGSPVIYKQERIGRFGRPFNILKFRTMRVDAEKLGPQLSHGGGEDDPRLTKIGRFLRVHHLDELPQLWNVLRGDMAFVGPRPERKFFIDKIMEHDKRYEYLYQIRPGVTSYATLYNGYTDTMEKMLRRLEYDLYYLGHRSWLFDIKILAKTFFKVVFGKNF